MKVSDHSNNDFDNIDIFRILLVPPLLPAERFTVLQRTADRATKQKYWRRNHVWQTMAQLVRGGRTAERAAIEIYRVYGHGTSVTKIIEAMIRDKRLYPGGVHPSLG